ncbi:Mitochondrial assembly of ribosomal large subunit protein 1 [Smittium culicis]|uniref:Mitochondrial assembly of ribosomal large subunit protein 1 n=1 Tax=Smittium culicis TaxID=133412 RepID=A0A1R1YF15_9FUNG|nr:Mitochondrial assembly of ribosomal large subunit protein 1 [Smittium culicis]
MSFNATKLLRVLGRSVIPKANHLINTSADINKLYSFRSAFQETLYISSTRKYSSHKKNDINAYEKIINNPQENSSVNKDADIELINKEIYPELYPESEFEKQLDQLEKEELESVAELETLEKEQLELLEKEYHALKKQRKNSAFTESNVQILQDDMADAEWFVDQDYDNISFQELDSDKLPLWKKKAIEAANANASENASTGDLSIEQIESSLGALSLDKKKLSESYTLDSLDSASLSNLLTAVLQAENAINPVVIDVSDKCSWTDKFVVAEASSVKHMQSISLQIISTIKACIKKSSLKNPTINVDGWDSNEWIAIDLGSVVAHIMMPDARLSYDLESLWTSEISPTSQSQSDFVIKQDPSS